jgi:hypothetical protein
MTVCVNCHKKEGTREFDDLVDKTMWCERCFMLLHREMWRDRILSADFNCSPGKCIEPWSDEQIKYFLDRNFPLPKDEELEI